MTRIENPQPPRWAEKLLRWRCPEDQLEEVQGDLLELFEAWVGEEGAARARRRYWLGVLGFLRPVPWRKAVGWPDAKKYKPLTPFAMFPNYFKMAWRNLVRHKGFSATNIAGLSAGMAVAILIGLWLHDELSFDKNIPNHDRIAQVLQHQTFATGKETWWNMPLLMGDELRRHYGSSFTHVVMSSWFEENILAAGDKKITGKGCYMEPAGPELLSLTMRRGTRSGLRNVNSILLSETLAKTLFGEADPMGKTITLDNKTPVLVTGVYADLPPNSSFSEMGYVAPWDLYVSLVEWIRKMRNPWGNNAFRVLVQIAPHADMQRVSAGIKDAKLKSVTRVNDAGAIKLKPEVFLHPLSEWHLYSDFRNGVNVGGRVRFVWLFGLIGVFVLLLACINFMNLSTAQSEKRAKEVGIRKAVGSGRRQLVGQFLGESLLYAGLAFGVSLLLAGLLLPWFNQLAGKKMILLWGSPAFWLAGMGFTGFTGLLAGSYPALYLSSFRPVKVLKGTFRAGRSAATPRKVLVVVQFTVSVMLIIGTLIVYQQVQYAKNRPIGYSQAGLVMVPVRTDEIRKSGEALRQDLLQSGAVVGVAGSESPVTAVWATNGGFEWEGKPAGMQEEFGTVRVTHEYGKTVGWELTQGRDFSRRFASDSAAFILNEAAVKYMGLADPVGKVIRWGKTTFTVIGVVKDLVMQSPYASIKPTLFVINHNPGNFVIARLHPRKSAAEDLATLEAVFKKYDPATPFEFQFADQEYGVKFGDEERIGKLAAFLTGLAIFISCLGLFGLAAFTAEQRTKEIGIRKVLGASVLQLWGLLSKDFLYLVVISLFLATPLALYFLSGWLKDYAYRTGFSWWIFALAGGGALLITLLTVSYQAIRTALTNPVKSLRNE